MALPFAARTFEEAMIASRAHVGYGRLVLAQLPRAREYKRDKDGKFGSGSGDGVRQSLADARNISSLANAAAREAKRITGRDIPFEMAGSDLQTAKEHCEGVMRGLDRFPRAELERVTVRPLADHVYAHTEFGGRIGANTLILSGTIVFNSTYASAAGRKKYEKTLAEGVKGWDEGLKTYGISDQKITSYHTRNSGTPTAIGIHEFGHVLDIATTESRSVKAVDELTRKLTAKEQRKQSLPGTPVRDSADFVQRSVSRYARGSRTELVAEAFTDAMVNGSGASELSKGIFDSLENEYNA